MSDQLARDIQILTELFKAGGWSELRIESEGLGILLSNDRKTPPLGGVAPARVAAGPAPHLEPADAPAPVTAPPASAPAPASEGGIDPAWVAVKAPNLGTFYRSPKPGAAPFVEVGQRVGATTEVCLIEVMKLFTSVQAGVAGTIARIAVADADLVEGGQALIYVARD